MKNLIYVYSGIEPGKKGAGNFVSYFLGQLREKKVEYKLISYNTPDGLLVKLAKRLGAIRLLKTIYYSFLQNISKNKIRINNKKVILFHPQSIGLEICIELIKSNKVYFYVLDNFLFCKKSYNYLVGTQSCTLCIDNSRAHEEKGCDFFPNQQEQEVYDLLLLTIQENLDKIQFLTQNSNQSLLLKKKFGSNISIGEIGMLIDLEERKKLDPSIEQYDFLYHNTLSEAKGLKFFLDIAKILKNYSFVLPYSRSEVKKVVSIPEDLKNVQFISLTWESGLASILENCKIVINPSLWSSPVEGALLKSIHHNGCVAVVSSKYSFPDELPEDICIKLSTLPKEAAGKLIQIIETEGAINRYKLKSEEWLLEYRQGIKSNISELINQEFNIFRFSRNES